MTDHKELIRRLSAVEGSSNLESWPEARAALRDARFALAEAQPRQIDREALADVMISADIISEDTRREARESGNTQREPFLEFADAVIAHLSAIPVEPVPQPNQATRQRMHEFMLSEQMTVVRALGYSQERYDEFLDGLANAALSPIPATGEGMAGQIVTASFEDGQDRALNCGLEDCECPEHEGTVTPTGTYITVRLDEDHPVGLWRVRVVEVTTP